MTCKACEDAARIVERLRTHHPHQDNERQDAVLTVAAQAIRSTCRHSSAESVVVPRGELEELHLYWNGLTNESAMLDALKNYEAHVIRWLSAPAAAQKDAEGEQNAVSQDTSNDLRLPHRDDPATWPAGAAPGGEAGLVERLIVLLNAVADAYDLEYDGEEGKHNTAVGEAGIALDDFAMEHGREAAAALSRSQPQEDVWEWATQHVDAVNTIGSGAADDKWWVVYHHDGQRSEGATLLDAIRAARDSQEKP